MMSMKSVFRGILGPRPAPSPWSDAAPVRQELFGVERLEQHAESLAAAQTVTATPPVVLPLRTRLNENAVVLLAAYRASAAEVESGRGVVPASEWLLDNYHLVEEQIREIREDLPPAYYRQLPKLADGPFAGYPRIFGIAWAFVAHTDSHFDSEVLRRFIAAYQRVQPLTIGELWAVAITLRIVLIENLRRLADQITIGRKTRGEADALADRLLVPGHARTALEADIATRSAAPLSERFAAQLVKRLRDQDPATTPALGWLEDRLAKQGSSMDEVVQHAQQRQGASNVSIRNIITSMRLISDIDWTQMFESVSLVDERLRRASDFAAMDFPSRNLYRSAIEQLARRSSFSELQIAALALEAAENSTQQVADPVEAERVGDPGFHLIAEGRRAFERKIGYRAPVGLWVTRYTTRLGIGGYVGVIVALTLVLLTAALFAISIQGLATGWLALFALAAFFPATEVATALVNRAITWGFGAVTLPGLELKAGVPQSLRTLVAVPTLLSSETDLLEQIERLEVHYLSGAGGDLTFALLSDGVDADQETLLGDTRLLAVGAEAIARLNAQYGPGPAGNRFLLLYRRRVFNAGEGKWIGWERKRGKLHELNRLLRGASDTTFVPLGGAPPQVPPDVRYVVTLDADTRLPRDAALRLIGKMAHPLNRPIFNDAEQRVIKGHAVLQPRVTPSLPVGNEGSFYQVVFSGPGGIDPYAAAASDVYQDLFGEGSYTGKGIYDVDAFETALAGRVPENTLLSHDLFEGVFARAGLASDVEVIEEFPSRYDVAARRQHRWTRGDWQLLPWILGRGAGNREVPRIGRAKMLDNLRRSLLAPSTLALLCVSWLLPMPAALSGTLCAVIAVAVPAFIPVVFGLMPRRGNLRLRNRLKDLASDARLALAKTVLSIAFLADQAWQMGDAIVRTLTRLIATRSHLLEWTTAAKAAAGPRLDVAGFYRTMAGGTALGLATVIGTVSLTPLSWPLIAPFAVLWLLAPALALWTSRSWSEAPQLAVTEPEARDLRLIARRTWRYFETFVTPLDNMLPPDNFQEDPRPVVAHRTSPTNIGLYLLSAFEARDFGWAGTTETIERLEAAFASLQKVARFRGHFFNWYGTQDLRPLEPVYVSSVDSGNLAGHLIALANACTEWVEAPVAANAASGVRDDLLLARSAIAELTGGAKRGGPLNAILDEIEAKLSGAQPIEMVLPTLSRLADKACEAGHDVLPVGGDERQTEAGFWLDALKKALAEHSRDRDRTPEAIPIQQGRLKVLAEAARRFALEMEFGFLLDPDRRLLSIGYSMASNSLDPSCYDLLASEARLASFFAIAKGDVPTRHWFSLGRAATPLGGGSALISWSGSMFEYLMPSLVMRAPAGSLLDQTSRLIVARQESYGRTMRVPWGVSESAYNARDIEFTYQYANFGVPGLGLKRGLSEDLVIAPYATGLATMVDPHAARENYARLAALGAGGRYGLYEALDFTRSRVPSGESVAIVRNFMAHHQGMTIVAIANTLHDGLMRARFHREPMIRASELLLQERMPRDVAVAHPRAEEVKASADGRSTEALVVRRLPSLLAGPPLTHLLSNGRYAVMLTTAGAGYSRWRDLAITRWREDATRDDWGSFVFLRDVQTGRVWSAAAQPLGSDAQSDVVFAEDHVEFTRRDVGLTTTTTVLVSGEHDGEVRRISVTNNGRRSRQVEVTSYAELVLTTQAADNAHPAFAKMFIQTQHRPEFGALIATRRRRSPDEPPIWAAHFAVVEGEVVGAPQYESDRASFLGRGGTIRQPAAMDGRALSNAVGTVLDPIFSLRHRVAIRPGNVARIAFWTLVASSEAELLDLVDKHYDRNAFDRAKTLAWTQAQVQLRHLDVTADEAADFQRLAAPILYADVRFRASLDQIFRGAGSQSRLWPHGISGDLPIVLLRIDDIQDIDCVRQVLRAHEYWRMKRLAVDLVVVNERASSYMQDLQVAIETAVRSSQSRPHFGDEPARGSVYALRADLINADATGLLLSAARLVLIARRGPIAGQLARVRQETDRSAFVGRKEPMSARRTIAPAQPRDLEFFNGLGGFAKGGREYVTVLDGGRVTPAPWINIVANPAFGFQASAEGSGYTWAENSRENQLTPWSNDPVADYPGEAIYVRDEITGDLWSPTAQPIRGNERYVAHHGFGYCRFEHETNGIANDLLQYVPLSDPIKISRLTLRNLSGRPRSLSVTAYAEWVLGVSRETSGPRILTEVDPSTGALLARNPWSIAFSERVAFADLAGRQTSWTADRTEFLGRNGDPSSPAALIGRTPLSGATGAGRDPCVALQRVIELAAGQAVEVVVFFGQCATLEDVRALIVRYRAADLDTVLAEVTQRWEKLLCAVQVKTPDRAMDILLNGWLLYQTIACRILARSAFYQASGAYGFRDQLQDGMALSFADSEDTRRHILRAAARQFSDGDVQHWWLPQTGQGVRTRISDDRVWLTFATATYVGSSGNSAILDEMVPFIEGPPLRPAEHDAFFAPTIAAETASLWEHCARGLDQCLELTGKHGLPLIGAGDWNDGMNRVGEGGKGESVWLGWLLVRTIELFAPLSRGRDAERVARWRAHARLVREAIEREAWDGEWYRRASFDDGAWLGSKENNECRIDSIAQSWAVLSRAADEVRAATAMTSLDNYLIRGDARLALLLWPPFDGVDRDPGYISGYPPGLRENGSQYSHAGMWAIMAFAQLGSGEKAAALFALLNPINHARTPDEIERYKVEPYVVAADVYSVPPHVGRGGWTWYTGSAGWMYRAGVEGILGLRREGDFFVVDPCIPSAWPGFEATIVVGQTRYDIRVENSGPSGRGVQRAWLDGTEADPVEEHFRFPLDGRQHGLLIVS
jgi:cyclic beta-1,2-glucan synthetase